jgi:hypothetical protein
MWGEDFESAFSLDEFGMKILHGFSAQKSIVTTNADFWMAADDGHAPVAFALGVNLIKGTEFSRTCPRH